MGISILIVLIVMFLVFMFSIKSAEDSAKNVALVIGLLVAGYILIKVIWG